MSATATGGTEVNYRFSTLRLIGNISSSGPGSGTLVVDGGLSISKQVYISDNLFVPNGTVSTNLLKVAGGTVGHVLKSIDNEGTCVWAYDEDYRFGNDTPTSISLQGRTLGIGITDSVNALGVEGNVLITQDLLFPNTNSSIQFPGIFKFNDTIFLSSTGQIGIGITASEDLHVVNNIRLGGILRVRDNDYTFPDNTDIITGISAIQDLSNKTIILPTISGDMDFLNSGRIINLLDPLSQQDATTKNYVDNLISGLVWKNPVIERGVTGPIPPPTTGDRYIIGSVGAEREWSGLENNIVEYDGTVWVSTIPTIGTVVPVINEGNSYIFDGSSWNTVPTILQSVLDYNVTVPPQNPEVGDSYIVAKTGSVGAWVNYQNQIVEWNGLVWAHTLPAPGDIIYVVSITDNIVYNGTEWVVSVPLPSVKNYGPVVPPGSVIVGDRYIIGTVGVTGIFAGKENQIAEWSVDNVWLFYPPVNGTALLVKEEEKQYVFNGTEWVLFGTLLSHANLTNLTTSDDHTQYLYLAGRIGGQMIYGGNTSTNTLQLHGNTIGNGNILMNVDAGNVGIGVQNPLSKLHVYDDFPETSIQIDEWKLTRQSDSFSITDTSLPKIQLGSSTSNSVLRVTNGSGKNLIEIDASATFTIGSTNAQALVKLQDSTTIGTITVNNTSKSLFIGSTNSIDLEDIYIGTNAKNTITVKQSGNVGILQMNPNAKFVIGDNLSTHDGLTIGVSTSDSTIKMGQDITNSLNIAWKISGHADISTGNIANNLALQTNGGYVSIGSTIATESLDVFGNIRLSGVLIRDTEIFTLPLTSDTLIGTTVNAILQNKKLTDTNVSFVNTTDNTKSLSISVSGALPGKNITLVSNQTNDNIITIPDITDTLITKNTIDILTNKSLDDTTTIFKNTSDISKQVQLLTGNANTNTKTLLSFIQTVDRTITVPDITDTLVTRNSIDVLTNKTLVGPVGVSGSINVSESSTFEKDVTINGTLFINGNQTSISNTVIQVADNMIHIADGNPADTLDTGLYSTYVSAGVTKFSGLYRDSTSINKPYRLFKDLTIDPTGNVDRLDTSYAKADLVLNTIDIENVSYSTDLAFNNTQMILTNTGYLGLNTTPSSMLHVNGNTQLGTQIYTNNTLNKIGLNTPSPITAIDATGNIRITNSGSISSIGTVNTNGTTTITGTGTSFTSLFVPGDRITINNQVSTVITITSDTILVVDIPITTGTSQSYLYSPASLTVNNQLVLSDRGYLGIGTIKPSYPLQVSTNSNTWSAQFLNGQSNINIGMNTGEGINISTGTLNTNSYGLRISNNNTTLFRVQTNGFIGMGNNNPSEYITLDYPLLAGAGAQLMNAKVGVWLGSTVYTAFVHNDLKTVANNYALKQHNTGDTFINAPLNKDVRICNNDSIMATFHHNGFIGINNDFPQHTLDINGSLNVSQDVMIAGNLIVTGVSVSLNASSISVEDPFIKLAAGNPFDISDIGFYGEYTVDGNVKNTGLYRDATDGVYKIFDGLDNVGTTQIAFSGTGYRAADMEVGTMYVNNSLRTRAAVYRNVQVVSTNITLDDTMNIILVDASSGDIIITVPRGRDIDNIQGISYTIVKRDSGPNKVKITCSNTDTIEGQTNIDLSAQFDDVNIYNIGSNPSVSNNGIWLIN